MATSMVHIRIDEDLKKEASKTLENMGLSVSDAVRVFLTRVVAEQQIPFTLKVPNKQTKAAMKEARAIAQARKARFAAGADLFHDLEKDSSE